MDSVSSSDGYDNDGEQRNQLPLSLSLPSNRNGADSVRREVDAVATAAGVRGRGSSNFIGYHRLSAAITQLQLQIQFIEVMTDEGLGPSVEGEVKRRNVIENLKERAKSFLDVHSLTIKRASSSVVSSSSIGSKRAVISTVHEQSPIHSSILSLCPIGFLSSALQKVVDKILLSRSQSQQLLCSAHICVKAAPVKRILHFPSGERTKFMKLGSKPDAFIAQGNSISGSFEVCARTFKILGNHLLCGQDSQNNHTFGISGRKRVHSFLCISLRVVRLCLG